MGNFVLRRQGVLNPQMLSVALFLVYFRFVLAFLLIYSSDNPIVIMMDHSCRFEPNQCPIVYVTCPQNVIVLVHEKLFLVVLIFKKSVIDPNPAKWLKRVFDQFRCVDSIRAFI